VAFYAGVPLLFSAYAAANNWQLIDRLGGTSAFLFYVAHALVPWLITGGMTSLVMRALRPWEPRPWVIMLIGSVIACGLAVPYTSWLNVEGHWFGVIQDPSTLRDPLRITTYFVRATAVWLAVNFVFDRFLGYPRYRYTLCPAQASTEPESDPQPTGDDATRAAAPAFLQRMRNAATLDRLIAIKAEQHYIQVITDGGSELVLYRLSDAVREVPLDCGVRVHRSWWISHNAVEAIHSSGKKMSVSLRNGLEVPVSIPYQALAKTVIRRGKLRDPAAAA